MSVRNVAVGSAVFDNDTVSGIRLMCRTSEFGFRFTEGSDTLASPTEIKTEYLWFSSMSEFPVARKIEMAQVYANDTISTTSKTLLAESTVIDVLIESDLQRKGLNSPDLHDYATGLPEGLQLQFDTTNPNELTIRYIDSNGDEYDVSFDVFNALGQRLAPTAHASCTGSEAVVTVRLLTNQSGAYLVGVTANGSTYTFKVTQ